MASPQLENGYTRVANEILEAVAKLPINGTQFRILMAIWRYTYGFNRKEHELSQGFLAEATGLNERQIRRELKKLIDMKIIKVVKEATFTSARVLAFNKHYKDWEGVNQTPPSKTDRPTEDKIDRSPPVELDHTPGVGLDPQERQYKDNIKDSTTPLPPPGDNSGGGLVEMNPDGTGEVYRFYQNNFGTISSFIAQKISDMIESIGPAMVIEAMKIAVTNGARRLNYVEAIIERWLTANIRSPADIEQDQKQWKQGAADSNSFRNAKNISRPIDGRDLEKMFREAIG